MWEQRYGFPEPARTPSGYRLYSAEDVLALRRVAAHRGRGVALDAAIELARAGTGSTDRPSIFGAIASESPAHRHQLRKRTLFRISRAIEDEALAGPSGGVVIASFQERRHFEPVAERYRRVARVAEIRVGFADFAAVSTPAGAPWQIPIGTDEPIAREWAVVVHGAARSACMVAWETPESGRDPRASEQDRRSEEHTSELQSRQYLVCRLLLEKKKNQRSQHIHLKKYLQFFSRSSCNNYPCK